MSLFTTCVTFPSAVFPIQRRFPPGFELIVVDGASTDGTRQYLDEARQRAALTLLHNPTGTKPAGLNNPAGPRDSNQNAVEPALPGHSRCPLGG